MPPNMGVLGLAAMAGIIDCTALFNSEVAHVNFIFSQSFLFYLFINKLFLICNRNSKSCDLCG
jgi:hypothetical protein